MFVLCLQSELSRARSELRQLQEAKAAEAASQKAAAEALSATNEVQSDFLASLLWLGELCVLVVV